MLELKHLKALQALYQYGTFSQAASELCVTTSALSHQIAALEGWLDVELISRKTRPFQFTKTGVIAVRSCEPSFTNGGSNINSNAR